MAALRRPSFRVGSEALGFEKSASASDGRRGCRRALRDPQMRRRLLRKAAFLHSGYRPLQRGRRSSSTMQVRDGSDRHACSSCSGSPRATGTVDGPRRSSFVLQSALRQPPRPAGGRRPAGTPTRTNDAAASGLPADDSLRNDRKRAPAWPGLSRGDAGASGGATARAGRQVAGACSSSRNASRILSAAARPRSRRAARRRSRRLCPSTASPVSGSSQLRR